MCPDKCGTIPAETTNEDDADILHVEENNVDVWTYGSLANKTDNLNSTYLVSNK